MKSNEETGIVTGDNNESRFSLRLLKPAVVSLVVVTLLAGGYWGWQELINNPRSTESLLKAYDSGGAAKDPKSALKNLSDIDESSASPAELARLYNLRGQAYQTKGDNMAALQAYEKALSYDGTQHDLYEKMGNLALVVSDYGKAQKYFQSALDYAKKQPRGEDPMLGDYIQMLEGRVMEAKQNAK